MTPDIAVDWHPRDEDLSEGFVRRVQDYLRELEKLDERFAHLGYSKQAPDAVDMEPEKLFHWVKKHNYAVDVDNRTLRERLSVSISVGSTRTKSSGRVIVHPGYHHPMWREESLLRAILELGIEFWRGDDAGIYYLTEDRKEIGGWSFWLRWQRNSVETPIPNVKSARTPSSTEPWLGGTLCTWPAHAPWKLLDAG